MPTAFSGVQVRAGLYFVVTSRCRGSRGVATGAPRYTSPRPSTKYCASNTMSCTCATSSRPLMRRMNSMFHGHHGASARTPCMYRWMASRVAGSSHDSGRSDGAARHDELIRRGQLAVETRQQVGHFGHRQHGRIELHLQRAHAGGELDDAGNALRAEMLVQHVHPGPHGQVEHHRPVLDQHTAVAVAAQRHVGAVGRGEPAEHAVVVVAGRRDHQRKRRPSIDVDGPQRRRPVGAHRNEPHRVARRHLAQLPPVAADHGDRADEPAEARSVRAEQDRGVAGEVQSADAVGVVVNVRRMQPGLAAVAARPLRLRADAAARRCDRS